ncbi:MAG: adenylosuccinate lyase [Gammaproteobacteria bacterium]|nr:adenylosuccinate lyase [Gammaproteobacteria bacterium]
MTAVSPVDGRYATQVAALRPICSEYGLLRYRVRIELHWLAHLGAAGLLPEPASLSAADINRLRSLADDFDSPAARRIKELERETNHDVKAVEYFVRELLATNGFADATGEFVHFACTSEDINNLSYALMLSEARSTVIQPALESLIGMLETAADTHADVAMLSRTHGQPATPTTLGKELANFAARLKTTTGEFAAAPILGKFNGAVGNYNAHYAALPETDWPALAEEFIGSLGLEINHYTTQIEPHDWIAAYAHALIRSNNVLLDLCRDVWGYISLGYFRQRVKAGETGSSTMPHKVNPIDFENAEGNIGIASATLGHLAHKLPVSRWQRDLSDSTALRNIGTGLAHMLIACQAIDRGFSKLEADKERISTDLDERWELLAEPIQTVMRLHGLAGGYEELKAMTRGRTMDRATIHAFIEKLQLPSADRERLLKLTPASYLGNAAAAARALRRG